MQLVPTNRTLTISIIAVAAVIVAAGLGWFLAGAPSMSVQAQENVPIDVGDIWYCSPDQVGVCETTIDVGDTITWDFSGAELPHTVTECGADCASPSDTPLWDSGLNGPNSPDRTFEVQFDQAGTFLYYCAVHPFAQLGRVVVGGGPAPTATSTQPAPAATATPTQPAPPPSATPTGLAGDANCDSLVTSVDSLLILQFVAGLLNSLSCPDNADVNSDGTANSVDSALILQLVAGLIPAL